MRIKGAKREIAKKTAKLLGAIEKKFLADA